jgi:hypothetical protein
MAIKCPCCNGVVEEYRITALSLKYLEQYVADFCKRPVEAITSVSEFRKDRDARGLFFYAAKYFGGYSFVELSKIYPRTYYYMSLAVNRVTSTRKQDVYLLDKELRSVLNRINVAA